MSLCFDEVVLVELARKRFLHERLLYLPEGCGIPKSNLGYYEIKVLGIGLAGGWGGGGVVTFVTRKQQEIYSVFFFRRFLRMRRCCGARFKSMHVLQCFSHQEGRMRWYSHYLADAGFFVLMRLLSSNWCEKVSS